MFPYRVTAMVAVSVVDLLILQTSLPPFDLWLLSQIHILSSPSSSTQHQHQTSIKTVISQHIIMTDVWFHNAIATDSPDGEGCRPEEALALKSYLHSLHQHRRMLPPNSPLQPLTFHLQANPSSISGVLSSTLLIEFPGCQKYIIDLLLKI